MSTKTIEETVIEEKNNRRPPISKLKKMGLKALIPFISHSPRIQYYFIDKARREMKGIINQTFTEKKWGEEYLRKRLQACDHLTNVVKETLPRLNTQTRKKLLQNLFYNQTIVRTEQSRKYAKRYGEDPPSFLLVSPSMACNLQCSGCWAREYEKKQMSPEEMNNVLYEAKKEMGIHFVVLTGGEPTIWKPLWDVVKEHSDIAFMPYTNGTMIDGKLASKIAELGNFYPCISIEGDEEITDKRRGQGTYKKIIRAMAELKDNGVFFGFATTHTRENHDALINDEFFDDIIAKGSRIGWLFNYVPLGDNPNPELMPTPEQRVQRYEVVDKLRENMKPLILYDFWMDGPLVGGCMGFGQKYIHINSEGFVEPCAFIHFAKDNIKDRSLTECLNSPWMKEARSMQPFNRNLFAPCPYLDNPEKLKHLVEKHEAFATHRGAEQCVQGAIYEAVHKTSKKYKRYLESKGLCFSKF